ncbi:hypothetical protein QTP88_028277 [Uroleucon formosanum]
MTAAGTRVPPVQQRRRRYISRGFIYYFPESCFVPRTFPVQAKLIGNKFAGKSGWHGAAAAPGPVSCTANNILRGYRAVTMYRGPLHNRCTAADRYCGCARRGAHARPKRDAVYDTDVRHSKLYSRRRFLSHSRPVYGVGEGGGGQTAHVDSGGGGGFIITIEIEQSTVVVRIYYSTTTAYCVSGPRLYPIGVYADDRSKHDGRASVSKIHVSVCMFLARESWKLYIPV